MLFDHFLQQLNSSPNPFAFVVPNHRANGRLTRGATINFSPKPSQLPGTPAITTSNTLRGAVGSDLQIIH